MSPIFFTLVTLFLTSIIWAIIFLMSWYTLGKKTYALIWSGAFIVSACQWATVLAKSWFSSDITYWMLATSFSMLSVLLGTWGHCMRTKANINVPYLCIFAVLVSLAVYYFKVISPHIGLSMSLYIYYDVLLLILNSIIIFQHREKSRPAEIGAVTTYLLCALFLFVAATIALLQGTQVNNDYLKLYTMINFITVPVAHVGMAVFIVFIMTSDLAEEMENLATTDVLTGCLNRRGFYQKAQDQLTSFINEQKHVCLIYWDIDVFKTINDEFGHAGGDKALTETAKRVQKQIKSSDIIGRIGGEEFVILVGRATYQEAEEIAERLRSCIASTPIKYKKHKINVTASFGVIDIKEHDVPIEKAIDLADKALYLAKEEGRNKVARASAFA